jgi:hypothetical protein
MGSFTELTLAFTFSENTPIEIIGAFAEWRTADEESRTGKTAPELPTLETSLGDDPFEADLHLGNFFGQDPMEGLTPLQQAAMWRYLMSWSDNAYFPGTSFTALQWEPYGGSWSLTTRTLPKEDPRWVQSIIAPLGRWSSDGTSERPWFSGYIHYEYDLRPVLIWSVEHEPFGFEGEFEDQ